MMMIVVHPLAAYVVYAHLPPRAPPATESTEPMVHAAALTVLLPTFQNLVTKTTKRFVRKAVLPTGSEGASGRGRYRGRWESSDNRRAYNDH